MKVSLGNNNELVLTFETDMEKSLTKKLFSQGLYSLAYGDDLVSGRTVNMYFVHIPTDEDKNQIPCDDLY